MKNNNQNLLQEHYNSYLAPIFLGIKLQEHFCRMFLLNHQYSSLFNIDELNGSISFLPTNDDIGVYRMSILSLIELKTNPNIPILAPGDTVKVSTRIIEGEKERTQLFQGVVIKVRHGGVGANFTVRRVAYGVGVERTFPLYSPLVEKVEVVRHGKVRRARLFYLRGLSAKKARIKEKRVDKEKQKGQE